ncbi:MAG: sugar transferase [Streptosporangiales bacterium]
MSVLENVTELTERVGSRAAIRIDSAVTTWQAKYRRTVIATDLLVGTVLAAMAFYVRFGDSTRLPFPYLVCSALFPIVWVTLLALARAHEPRFLFTGTEEFRRVVMAGCVLLVGIALVSYAGKFEVARSWVLLSVPPATICTVLARYVLRKRVHRRRLGRGAYMYRTVMVGYERATANLVGTLRLNRYHGLDVVGACLPPNRIADAGDIIKDCGVPVLGDFGSIASTVERVGADVVVVLACPELDGPTLRRLGWELEKSGTELLVAPALMEVAGPRVTVRPVADLPLLHVEHSELTHWRRALKSTFDRVGAALCVALASPLLLAIAAAIKLADGGPIFFRQTRIGHEGREFSMLKFRTMQVNAEQRLGELLALNDSSQVLFKMRQDPRVTGVGSFLRRYSLDEIPQLVNVLRGEMSLVGPRPPLPREVEQYERDVYRRFAVRPGITGLWQVSGRSDLPWEETVRLDIRYVERWSLLLDVLIICRTLGAVLRKSGAY